MPELPEVEVTRMGIDPFVAQHTLTQMRIHNAHLRWLVDARLPELLKNAHITHTARRGKYLALHCDCADGTKGVLLIHLGMSGSLRIVDTDTPRQKHDHIEWIFAQYILRYHDPRRFGAVLWHDNKDGDWLMHPRLLGLGVEPFDAVFTGEFIYNATRTIKQDIKIALMSGRWVVGVGNIYASEVLFLCKISPLKAAHTLSKKHCRDLAEHIPALLQSAITRGGSTLKDFVNSNGDTGYFQMHFNVYDRANTPCPRCATPIVRVMQAQRATYYCPVCQK